MRRFISHVVRKPKTIPRSLRRSTCLAQMGPRRSTGGAFFASCLRACLVDKNQGSTFTSARVLVGGQGFGLTALRRPCSDAFVADRICVITKGLGFLHWLAHATEAGPFLGASISPRPFSSVPVVCRRCLDEKIGCTAIKDTAVIRECAPIMVSRAAGRMTFCIMY